MPWHPGHAGSDAELTTTQVPPLVQIPATSFSVHRPVSTSVLQVWFSFTKQDPLLHAPAGHSPLPVLHDAPSLGVQVQKEQRPWLH